jgi:hypothetical protein
MTTDWGMLLPVLGVDQLGGGAWAVAICGLAFATAAWYHGLSKAV